MNSLVLSLVIAAVATTVVALVAIPMGHLMARARFPGRSFVEAFLALPLVLPPTVVGYLILAGLGARGWPGAWLHAWFDYSIVFRIEGAVLAAAIVAFPLVYLPAKAAFAAIEHEYEDVAALQGASRLQIFWHVSLPSARLGIGGGLILGFARALGEFGATVMVFGWQPGRQTLPISIYSSYEQGKMNTAWPSVLLMIVICFIVVGAYNRLSSKLS